MTETRPSNRRTLPSTSPGTKEPRRVRADIRNHSGSPILFVNDRPCVPIVLNLSKDSNASHILSEIKPEAETGSEGLKLVRVQLDNLCWPAPRELDAAAIDEALKALAGLPESFRFLLSVPVDPPHWWLKANPKEHAEYARRASSIADTNTITAPVVSFASTIWKQSAGEALERLLRYVLSTPTGNRLIGIQILAGEAGTFTYPEPDRMPDIGPCMTTAFIKYTVDKYRRNEGLLRKAWFDTRAEFSVIRCPSAAEREKAEYGLFRNPHRSRKIMDYYECLANEQSSAALSFCATVKRVSGGALLVGLELAQLTPRSSIPECGHSFPEPLLTSGDVDFFVETTSSGSVSNVFRPYRGSIALNGKFVFAQSATGASFNTACAAAGEAAGAIVEAPKTAEELSSLSTLASTWVKRISRQIKYQVQVALMLDPGAGLVVSHRPDAAPIQSLVLDQIALLRKAGVVYSTFAIGDLFHPQFPNHKVYLFPNSFYLSEPERRKLDARVKRGDQTGVWFWAPGIIGAESINAEDGTKCCGQKLRVEPADISLRARIVDSNDPLTWGRHAGDVFGAELAITPRCTVADSKASRLGANSDNKTTFSVHRFDTWTSVVYGSFPVPLDLLQNLFRSAACHIYCGTLKDGDKITSDGRALFVTSINGGSYTLSLPGQYDITDAASGKRVGAGVSEIIVSLARGEARLFELRAR